MEEREGQQGLGKGIEHSLNELAEAPWAYQLVPCARAKGKVRYFLSKAQNLEGSHKP